MDKAKLLVMGSVLRALNLFSVCFVALFMTPFLITSLGDRIYGMWMLVGSVFGFYDLLDLGLTSAVKRFLPRELGLKDYKACNRVINTALLVFTIIGSIAFAITVAVAFLSKIFIHDPQEIIIFRNFLLITGVSVSFMFIMRTFNGILESHLRYDINVGVDLLNLVLRSALIIIFLKKGYGLIAIAVIMLSVNTFCHMISIFFTTRIARYMRISYRYFDWKKLKIFFGYSIYSFLGQLSARIGHDIDNFVIAGFLGVGYVTVYSIASRLVRYFVQLLWATMGLMTPIFSHYEAVGDFAAIREKFAFVTKISWAVSLIIGGNMLLFGKYFILRWVGPEYTQAYTLLLILGLSSAISLTNITGINLVYGISKHKFATILGLCSSLTNLLLSLFLVRHLGLVGVALGTAIPGILTSFVIMPLYICKVISYDPKEYYGRIALPFLLYTGIYLLAVWFCVQPFVAPGYLILLFLGSVTAALYLFIAFHLMFNHSEKQYIINAVFHRGLRLFLFPQRT